AVAPRADRGTDGVKPPQRRPAAAERDRADIQVDMNLPRRVHARHGEEGALRATGPATGGRVPSREAHARRERQGGSSRDGGRELEGRAHVAQTCARRGAYQAGSEAGQLHAASESDLEVVIPRGGLTQV